MNPTTKHALVIQGSEEEKKQACIEIRDWAVKNEIPMTYEFKTTPYSSWLNVVIWYFDNTYENKWLLLKTEQDTIKRGYTIHNTVESFKKVFGVESDELKMKTKELQDECHALVEMITKKNNKCTHQDATNIWIFKKLAEQEIKIQEFKPIELKNLTNPKK